MNKHKTASTIISIRNPEVILGSLLLHELIKVIEQAIMNIHPGEVDIKHSAKDTSDNHLITIDIYHRLENWDIVFDAEVTLYETNP